MMKDYTITCVFFLSFATFTWVHDGLFSFPDFLMVAFSWLDLHVRKEMGILATYGVDREKAKEEMGTWLADYFDDAGYMDWETQAPMYKAMIMSAFPPIDSLDAQRPEYHKMPVEQFEDNMTRVLAVMDSHLARQRIHFTRSVFSLFRTRWAVVGLWKIEDGFKALKSQRKRKAYIITY